MQCRRGVPAPRLLLAARACRGLPRDSYRPERPRYNTQGHRPVCVWPAALSILSTAVLGCSGPSAMRRTWDRKSLQGWPPVAQQGRASRCIRCLRREIRTYVTSGCRKSLSIGRGPSKSTAPELLGVAKRTRHRPNTYPSWSGSPLAHPHRPPVTTCPTWPGSALAGP